MHTILMKLVSIIIAPIVLIGGLFSPNVPVSNTTIDTNPPSVGATLPQATGVFETSLATPITSTATSMTLTSNAIRGGGAVSGYTCFTVDEGSAQAEVICGTVSSTTVSSLTRGISYSDGVTSVSGNKFAHRRGANVKITDFPIIQILKAQNNGDATFANELTYEGATTCTVDAGLCPKSYIDGVAIAGSPDSSTTVKGIGRVSVAPVSATIPIFVGDNDGRVPTQSENDAQVGNNTDIAVGTGNKFVTQTGLQHGAEKYAADSGANDTYVITLSPVPTSYTNGMVIHFKANTVNTGAATINVNGLGAKTIVKYVNTTLADGDIADDSLNTLIYDGTNFVLQNPIANLVTPVLTTGFKNGVSTVIMDTSTTDVITHNLGVIPKRIRIDAISYIDNGTGQIGKISSGSYDSSGQSSVSNTAAGSGTDIPVSSTTYAMIYPVGGSISSGGAIGTVTSTQFTITITGSVSNGKFKYHWEVEG